MMPNLGQGDIKASLSNQITFLWIWSQFTFIVPIHFALNKGGCQAIEDAFVLAQNIQSITKRDQIPKALADYHSRRLIRSAAVQGLSRFASDIIIRGFDTPAKINFTDGKVDFENFNYAGIVTRVLQPILPIFFMVQFNFLYDGWKNEMGIDFKAAMSFSAMGGLILLLATSSLGELGIPFFGFEGLIGAESVEGMFGAGLSPSFWVHIELSWWIISQNKNPPHNTIKPDHLLCSDYQYHINIHDLLLG